MYRRYKSDCPNQVHQLLVTVSKHFHIGAKGQLRYQFKAMDVNLNNLEKSERELVVYYLLRDHFSGVFYAEITSGKKLISINDFILRAWLQKPDLIFCGVPENLMVTKIVENHFPEVSAILEQLNIPKINPPSGFASGMREITAWEKRVRFYTIAYPVMESFSLWNPRACSLICANENKDKINIWNQISARVPDDNYIKYLVENYGSKDFKLISDYPSLEEMSKLVGTKSTTSSHRF